jgi:alginate O-acetyltransferase complex protein AlgI
MAAFSNAAFPVLVAVCYVLGQLRSPIKRATWFGGLNVVALSILFGLRPALALLILSAVYWSLLAATIRMNGSSWKKWSRPAGPLLYISAAAIFVLHKSLLEPQNDFSTFPPISLLSQVGSFRGLHSAISTLQIVALSYIFLRLIDLIRSVLDGAKLLDPLALSGFLVPFFMTPAGPVNVYVDHQRMDQEPVAPVAAAHFIDSLFLIVCGYFLKFVVAQSFSLLVVGISGSWPTDTLEGTAVFLFYVLLEFSGYSLIALGVGKLLGVPTPVNFNHPYLSASVGEFWTRWHMSLGQFVRRNLYTPTQVFLMRRFGRKNHKVAYLTNIAALSLPFIFVGIWHRFAWGFLIWGVSLSIIVAAEKLIRERVLVRIKFISRLPKWTIRSLGMAYTLTVVILTLHIASRDFLR